jgi:hypothetical protein
VKYFRDLKLLPSKGYCDKCTKETDLPLPTNAEELKSFKYTMCRTPECTAKSYNSKKTIHFKRGSIFEKHWCTKMDLIVLAIWCFVVMLPPSVAALQIGGGLSADTIGKIYCTIRLACQAYNNRHYRKRLGGTVMPGDPRFRHAVNLNGRHRVVVEYDESE